VVAEHLNLIQVEVTNRARAKVNEMTTATETFKKTATARYAADAAEDAAGNVSEFANDVTCTAGKNFDEVWRKLERVKGIGPSTRSLGSAVFSQRDQRAFQL
jgi:hypothetical protein